MAPRPNESIGEYTAGIKRAAAVAPSDSTDLNSVTRGIYVGASGNLAVVFADDIDSATVTLVGLAAGVWHPMQVRRVLSTATTATGIVAGY